VKFAGTLVRRYRLEPDGGTWLTESYDVTRPTRHTAANVDLDSYTDHGQPEPRSARRRGWPGTAVGHNGGSPMDIHHPGAGAPASGDRPRRSRVPLSGQECRDVGAADPGSVPVGAFLRRDLALALDGAGAAFGVSSEPGTVS